MHHPDALPQRDARRWPARHGCPVGRLCHLEVVHASDVLDDAVAGVLSEMSTRKAKCVLVFTDKSDSTRPGPAAIFSAALVFHVMSRAQLRELMVLFVVCSTLTLAVFFLALLLLPFETFNPFSFPRFPGFF